MRDATGYIAGPPLGFGGFPTMSQPSVTDVLRATAGRPRLVVSRSALRHNVRLLRDATGPESSFCAVVKADAYGHGAAAVVDALCDAFDDPNLPNPAVDWLAVATIGEALKLPDHDVPVMVLRPVECVYLGENRHELEAAVRRGITLSLATVSAADDVARVAERLGVRARVQVMLDTGMNREMCEPRHFAELLDAVSRRPALELVATGTHFTDGEAGDELPHNDEQCRQLLDLLDEAAATPGGTNHDRLRVHVANSGGILGSGRTAATAGEGVFDLVRGGLALYGIDPCDPPSNPGLRPAAKWTAPLLLARDLAPGQSVGYGRTWTASKPIRLGTIPVGYADGYQRILSNKSVVRIPAPEGENDAFCPLVGRVSMDYITVDLTSAPWIKVGDEITLVDNDPASPCSAANLAKVAETIPYEILCGIGRRVTRVYVD